MIAVPNRQHVVTCDVSKYTATNLTGFGRFVSSVILRAAKRSPCDFAQGRLRSSHASRLCNDPGTPLRGPQEDEELDPCSRPAPSQPRV